jgi:hypothetical protein
MQLRGAWSLVSQISKFQVSGSLLQDVENCIYSSTIMIVFAVPYSSHLIILSLKSIRSVLSVFQVPLFLSPVFQLLQTQSFGSAIVIVFVVRWHKNYYHLQKQHEKIPFRPGVLGIPGFTSTG